MIQELPIPPVALEHRSVEMLRVWLANDKVHVSLNIGFWEERDLDERSCYGILLADIIHHIANAHHEQYGHDIGETFERVKTAFLAEIGHSTSDHIGEFVPTTWRDDAV